MGFSSAGARASAESIVPLLVVIDDFLLPTLIGTALPQTFEDREEDKDEQDVVNEADEFNALIGK